MHRDYKIALIGFFGIIIGVFLTVYVQEDFMPTIDPNIEMYTTYIQIPQFRAEKLAMENDLNRDKLELCFKNKGLMKANSIQFHIKVNKDNNIGSGNDIINNLESFTSDCRKINLYQDCHGSCNPDDLPKGKIFLDVEINCDGCKDYTFIKKTPICIYHENSLEDCNLKE